MSEGLYDGTDIPDSIVPYVGIRAWRVSQDLRNQERLFSLYKTQTIWPVEGELVAQCHRTFHPHGWFVKTPMEPLPAHEPPFPLCTCGIYALHERVGEGEPSVWRSYDIVGLVFIYGHVLEGSKGIRGSKARVAALLYEEDKPIERMAELYGVPVIEDLEGELLRQRKMQGT